MNLPKYLANDLQMSVLLVGTASAVWPADDRAPQDLWATEERATSWSRNRSRSLSESCANSLPAR